MRKDNPCDPKCPERSATCHAECPRYAAFAEKCERERNERSREKYFSEATKKKLDRDAKRKNHR